MNKRLAGILRSKPWKNFPILLAYEGDGQLYAWCPFCKKFHYHGLGEGHRGAHCVDSSSPFHKTGYMVIKFSSWNKKGLSYHEKRIIKMFAEEEKRRIINEI